MNVNRLRGKIAEAGLSQRGLAKILCISENTLSNKLTGKVQFTVPEVIAICNALHITDASEKDFIFLQ